MIFIKWLRGCILLFCSFCNENTLYTAEIKLTDNIWERKTTCVFDFTIQDAIQAYDLYLVIQYTHDYPYQNLHIQYQLQNEQVQLNSTVSMDHLLSDSKTGKPLGKGWRAKKCLKVPLITNHYFEKPGDYSLTFVQFMRTEQLTGITSVGIQLCKSQQKKISHLCTQALPTL